jgi:hypothetical protein
MKALNIVVINTLTFIITIILNYLTGAGKVSGNTMADISRKYPTLITPENYAFSIWSIIYIGLTAFIVYQWYEYKHENKNNSIQKTGPWFAVSNIANSIWVVLWVHDLIGWSVLAMIVLLLSLIKLSLNLDLEIKNVRFSTIALVWWPVTIYLGWIILATVVNVAVLIEKHQLLANILSPDFWAIVVIAIATIIYLALIITRNMREAALVGIWGLIAIAVNQWKISQTTALSAIVASSVLLIATIYHGYKNRKHSIFYPKN